MLLSGESVSDDRTALRWHPRPTDAQVRDLRGSREPSRAVL